MVLHAVGCTGAQETIPSREVPAALRQMGLNLSTTFRQDGEVTVVDLAISNHSPARVSFNPVAVILVVNGRRLRPSTPETIRDFVDDQTSRQFAGMKFLFKARGLQQTPPLTISKPTLT